MKKENFFWLLLLVPVIIYLYFGFCHISQFMTADEHFWFYERTPQYWKSYLSGNWEKTRINDKPGITTAFVSGAGLLWEKNPEKSAVKEVMGPDASRQNTTERIGKTFRLPILIFNAFFIFYLFWVLKKITEDKWLSLIGSSAILLSPTLLGISQIVNPDSLLWTFSFALLLSFISFIKTCEKKFIILSALFLALSLLSKYSACIFYPVLFFIIAIFSIFDFIDKKVFIEKIKLFLWSYLGIVFGSMAIFSVFMPAVFIKPNYLFKGTIGYPGMFEIMLAIFSLSILVLIDAYFNKSKLSSVIINFFGRLKNILPQIVYAVIFVILAILLISGIMEKDFLNIWQIPFDVRQDKAFIKNTSLIQKIFLEFRQLTFSLHPLIIIGIFLAMWQGFRRKISHEFLVFPFSAFILIFFTAVMTQGLLANIRYSIVLFPVAIIIGTIGLYTFFINLKKIKISPVWLWIFLIICFVFSIWKIKPFYFNYTNSLLPKYRIITGAWGYGGYEAVQFINSQSDKPENLKVWADYPGVCEFFVGECMAKKYTYDESRYDFDYFVFSRRGQILESKKKSVTKKPVRKDPAWRLFIGDREENYIKVYKANNK